MNPTEISLIAVTVAFTGLVLWVYWPSRRQKLESLGRIPLDDDQGVAVSGENPFRSTASGAAVGQETNKEKQL